MTTFFQTYGVPAGDVGGNLGVGAGSAEAGAAAGGGSGAGGAPQAMTPKSSRASKIEADFLVLMLRRAFTTLARTNGTCLPTSPYLGTAIRIRRRTAHADER
jgi:hypothetical protein